MWGRGAAKSEDTPVNIVSMAMQYLTPMLVDRIASSLGIQSPMVRSAIAAILPTILAGIAGVASKPGGGRQITDVLGKQNTDILGDLGSIFGGAKQNDVAKSGTDTLRDLLGGNAVSGLTSAVGKFAGIGDAPVQSLVGMLAPVALGTLAKQQKDSGLDAAGRPIENPKARYGKAPFEQLPGPLGAHNWQPMAFNPDTGLAYIPAQEIPQAYAEDPRFTSRATGWNTGIDFSAGVPPIAPPEVAKLLRSTLKGRLIAWDPVAREPRWSVEHGNAWNGGVLSTAGGIVFQGKLNGEFDAYDAATGDKLWSHELKSGGASGPGTYMIDGEQYVTITTGWGSAFALAAGFGYDEKVSSSVGKVVTFKIGGTQEIADTGLAPIDTTPKAPGFGSLSMISSGAVHYARNCTVCHGPLAVSSGVLPDLRWSAITGNKEAWKGVVLDGNLAANGMVSFADYLTPDEGEAVLAYVLAQAHAAAKAGEPK